MECETFEARLHQVLDVRGRPEMDELLLSHVAVCEECRQVLAAQEMLLRGLELCEAPELPPDFTRRIVQRVHASSSLGAGHLWFGAAMAVAAGVLVAALLTLRINEMNSPTRPDSPNKSVAVIASGAPEAQPEPERVGPGNPPRAKPGGDSSGSVATPIDMPEYSRDALRKLGNLASHLSKAGTPAASSKTLHGEKHLIWIDRIMVGLRPLANSMTAAIHVLRRSFLGSKERERQDSRAMRYQTVRPDQAA